MNIDILKIDPDPEQPRQTFIDSEMSELLNSIKENGILQPIIVEKDYATDKKDRYLLLDGERRYRCAKKLNFTEIPTITVQGPLTFEERTIKRFHIQEQHKNWTLFDKARSIMKLKKNTKLTYQEVAAKLNMFAPNVHNWISISEFSEYTQQVVLDKKIKFNYLIFLIRLVKTYVTLVDLPQIDIEKKLVAKIENKIISTVSDIQKLSNTVLKPGFKKEKIAFLSNDTQTLAEFFALTNETDKLLQDKTLLQAVRLRNILITYTAENTLEEENKKVLIEISELLKTILK